jgi:hypothetical protein
MANMPSQKGLESAGRHPPNRRAGKGLQRFPAEEHGGEFGAVPSISHSATRFDRSECPRRAPGGAAAIRAAGWAATTSRPLRWVDIEAWYACSSLASRSVTFRRVLDALPGDGEVL